MLPFAWVQVAFLWVRCSLNLGAFCSKKVRNEMQNREKTSKKYAQNPMFSIGLAYV